MLLLLFCCCIPLIPASISVSSTSLPDPKAPPALGVQKSSALYNIVKPFEKVRQEDRQNELYAKSAFVLHERTSKYVLSPTLFANPFSHYLTLSHIHILLLISLLLL